MFEFTIPTGGVPRSPRSIATSVLAHALAVALLFAIRFSSTSNVQAPHRVTLIAPVENLPARPKIKSVRPRDISARPKAPIEVPASPSIAAPVVHPPGLEMPKPVVLRESAAPPIHVPELVPENKGAIKPSGFTDSQVVPPVPVPKLEVKNAGFETPAAPPKAASHLTLTEVGSFDSTRASESSSTRNAAALNVTGFSGASTPAPLAARRMTVTSGTFGDTTLRTNQQVPLGGAAVPKSTPVEILSKPKPLYTTDARAQRIEGEVLLEVEFSASGEVDVLRLVRGLGHGLDENAVAAARGIRFRPASRANVAVDSTAVVHILFELAN